MKGEDNQRRLNMRTADQIHAQLIFNRSLFKTRLLDAKNRYCCCCCHFWLFLLLSSSTDCIFQMRLALRTRDLSGLWMYFWENLVELHCNGHEQCQLSCWSKMIPRFPKFIAFISFHRSAFFVPFHLFKGFYSVFHCQRFSSNSIFFDFPQRKKSDPPKYISSHFSTLEFMPFPSASRAFSSTFDYISIK